MLITLDGLSSGGQFDGRPVVVDGVQWVASKLTGWWGSAPATRVKHTERPTAHGAHRSAAYLGTRSYQLELTATALDLSAARMRGAEQTVAAICGDPGELYPLVVADHAATLCAYVERDGEILGTFRDGLRYSTVFSVPLVAPDPFRYSVGWVSAGPAAAGSTGAGGIDTSGAGIGTAAPGIATGTAPALAAATAAALGTRDSQVVLQVTGSTTDVQVVDLGSEAAVGIRGDIAEGESVFVNTCPRPAYDVPGCPIPIPAYGAVLGTASARGAVWVSGGWPVLPPGAARTYRLGGGTGTGAALTVHTRGVWT